MFLSRRVKTSDDDDDDYDDGDDDDDDDYEPNGICFLFDMRRFPSSIIQISIASLGDGDKLSNVTVKSNSRHAVSCRLTYLPLTYDDSGLW